MDDVIFPRPLRQGDRIAIVSPASIINPDYVEGAVNTLRSWGFDPWVAPHALGRSGTYSGSADERFDDLRQALLDPSTRAILCSRGGYGAAHLLDRLDTLPLAEDPKWLIGFSDISALHALMRRHGIASVHASMAKQLTLDPESDASRRLLNILTGQRPELRWKGHQYSRHGLAHGPLVGGNLAVLAQLINTPFDILTDFTRGDMAPILYIEDISEPIYKIERILWQLRLNGALERLAGLIVGQFTEYKADRNYPDMESMIRDMTAPYGYPVAFGAPIGHIGAPNQPIIHGAPARLAVTPEGATLSYE